MRKLTRVGTMLAAPILLSAGLTDTAQAAAPIKEPVSRTVTATVTDLCSFPVMVTAHVEGFKLTFNSGDNERLVIHATETDTFSANGNTLQSVPYTSQYHQLVRNGELIKAVTTGVGFRVPLPNGQVTFAAGLFDFLAAGDVDFLAVPTHGVSKNFDALCAALAG